MRKAAGLYKQFQPDKYELSSSKGQVKIFGRKIGPPSKRITLHQKGLKITGAQIIRIDKRGNQEFAAARINHLPTFEQVRLHSQETLFPGTYEITIDFLAKPNQQTESPKRNLFPCIDEPEAWTNATIEIT
ncbi:hypothetical protein BVY00_00630 [bacterium G20]|nr:hypothetical protein BVY00_00630 [bacterium G20]